MKKLFLLLVVVLAVFVIYNRQRLYVRDPLGSVTRDGVREPGAQVYLNYSNDIVIENDNPPAYILAVHSGDNIGTPKQLKGMHWLVYLADADPVPLLAAAPNAHLISQDGKLVHFRDTNGKDVNVKLR